MPASYLKGPKLKPAPNTILFKSTNYTPDVVLIICYMQHLLAVSNAGLLNTFFQCGQATFMQWCSRALNKHVLSGPVLAGYSRVLLDNTYHYGH